MAAKNAMWALAHLTPQEVRNTRGQGEVTLDKKFTNNSLDFD